MLAPERRASRGIPLGLNTPTCGIIIRGTDSFPLGKFRDTSRHTEAQLSQ